MSLKITYDEILEAMKQAYCRSCGASADDTGDVGARLQAVASELYSLACNEDYIIRQSYPQTATGGNLDNLARLRGIDRKKAYGASVYLTFSINEPAESNIIIPKGTICACSVMPYIQFKTTNNATLRAGNTTCKSWANALNKGEKYNVGAGKVDVMVNPPTGITAVINENPAKGGVDGESDEHLRNRVINSYQVPATGFTPISMANAVEAIVDVIECRIYINENALDVYVRTADNTISNSLRTKITDALYFASILGMSVNIAPAQPVAIDLNATIRVNDEADSGIGERARKIIYEAVSGLGIGGRLELSALTTPCIKLDGIEQVSFTSSLAENGIISIGHNEYVSITQGDIEVNVYE